MTGLAVSVDYLFCLCRVAVSEYLEAFSDTVRGVTDDRVEELEVWSDGGVCDVCGEDVAKEGFEVVMLVVSDDAAVLLASDLTTVDVRAERDGAVVRAGDEEGTGPCERVICEFGGSAEGDVGGDEGEFGIEGGGANVWALLEVVFESCGTVSDADLTAEEDKVGFVERSRWVYAVVEAVFFHDRELKLGVLHPYGAVEVEVAEGFDEVSVFCGHTLSEETFNVELE